MGSLSERGCSESTRGKGAGAYQGGREAGLPGRERSLEALSWEHFGFRRERVWVSEPAGNGLGFLRKEEGPGVRTGVCGIEPDSLAFQIPVHFKEQRVKLDSQVHILSRSFQILFILTSHCCLISRHLSSFNSYIVSLLVRD